MPRSPLHKVLSWVTPEKGTNGDTQPMAETAHFRRSSRLAVAIPIRVSGHDEIGESFDVKAQTVEVSRNGAKITTTHPLAPRAEITISNPASGRSCPAKVI